MHSSRVLLGAALLALAAACDGSQTPTAPSAAKSATSGNIGVNVILNRPVTDALLADLGAYGSIKDVLRPINGVVMVAGADKLAAIKALSYVKDAGQDEERQATPVRMIEDGAPIDNVAATNFSLARNMWNLDMVNVTQFGANPVRQTTFDGTGVYVGILDTGLLDSWRTYFPQERIAQQFATAFTGGGAFARGEGAEQPNKWEHDQNSHGTHVTSTVLGFNRVQCCDAAGNLVNTSRNGVAPKATVIPVKVLNNGGGGWSSAIAAGIMYTAGLKQPGGPLAGVPMVISMSLGGGSLAPIEKAAIDYATSHGVVVVVAAGNSGEKGMSYPGAYPGVISVASVGWTGEWKECVAGAGASSFWTCDVADPTSINDVYISDFSGRQKAGQELDVAAPGSWVVGPYQNNSATGKPTYFFLGGTSMATPHVSGIVALMLQKYASLTHSVVEAILKSKAIAIPESPAAGVAVKQPDGSTVMEKWKSDATGAGLITVDQALAGTP